MQTGFSDQNAYIRELTLKSMLSLAPKLSHKTLTNSVLKHLSKLQVCGGGLYCVACVHACMGPTYCDSARRWVPCTHAVWDL